MEFQKLYQELTQSAEMIQALLAGISQEEAQVKPNQDSWSILEVVCHLYDGEREDFRDHPKRQYLLTLMVRKLIIKQTAWEL